MEVGIKGLTTSVVEKHMTAAAMGSGTLEVLSTPYMIAIMEGTCQGSVKEYLEEGQATVGTKVCVSHLAAVGLGKEVTCESEIVEIDRRKLVFSVKVMHEDKLIGEGTHERFIIDTTKFMSKA
ncbi:MAG: thioesterase family protein [Clostridiales bacterium]|nr:thioesterase family protein [Candidatus Crickella merdequi]